MCHSVSVREKNATKLPFDLCSEVIFDNFIFSSTFLFQVFFAFCFEGGGGHHILQELPFKSHQPQSPHPIKNERPFKLRLKYYG